MANKEIVIDVVSEYADHASSGLQQTGKNAEKAAKELENLGKKNVKPKLGLDDKASRGIDKVGKKGDGLGKKKWTPKLDVKDLASKGISKALSLGSSFGKKTFSALLKVDDKATKVIKKIPSALSKVKNSLFSLKTLAGGIATGVAAKKLIGDPIALADEYETYQIGFETMLKSKKKATKFMNQAKTFASVTPFDTADVVSNAQRMLAYGFNYKDIIPDLTKIGNASAALGAGEEGITRIAMALGQMKTAGKLNAGDMKQLTEVGINAWQYLADAEGKSIAQIREMSQKGEMSGEKAVKTILNGLKEFDGMMDKTSNSTVSGLMSNIQDVFDINIVSKWGRGLQKGATKGLGAFADYLDKSDAKLKEAGTSLEKLGEQASTTVFAELEKAGNKISDVITMPKFQNASLGGKISIAWDELIANPFSDWWESKGKPGIVKKITGIGKDVAKGAGNWFKESLKDLLPGGDKAGIEDYIAGALTLSGGLKLFKGGKFIIDLLTGGNGKSGDGSNPLGGMVGTMNVSAATVNVNGGLGNTNNLQTGKTKSGKNTNDPGNDKEIWLPESAKKKTPKSSPTKEGPVREPGGLFGLGGKGITLKNGETVAATGLKAFLGNLAVKLGSGATTATGASVVGGSSVLGGLLGLGGLVSAAGNFVNSFTSNDAKTKKKENYRGGAKVGLVGTGAATGAAIGSFFGGIGAIPGALIGSGVGGLAAIFGGNKIGDGIRNFVGSRKEALKDKNSMRSKNQEYWTYSKDSISGINSSNKEYENLANAVQKNYEESKKNTKETSASSKSTKIFSGITSAAGGQVSGLGGTSASSAGMVGTMGAMSLTAGGDIQTAGGAALSFAGALASAAATISAAAATASAQASAISSITSGAYLTNNGSSSGSSKKSSGKKSSGKSSGVKLRVPTALPQNGKFFHNAKGGHIGSHIVSELGEEGPEMVIPLTKYRSRALSLWGQAGSILGVTRNAKGGVSGGSVGSGSHASGSNQTVVNVGGITISVEGSSGNIVNDIKNAKGEIADVIMQAIADAIGSSASNRTAEVM